MRWRVLIAAITLGVGCMGCGVEIDQDAYVVDIEGNVWEREAVIEVPNIDTISRCNISLFVKHQPYEALDSLRVRIYSVAPDERVHTEEVTLYIDGCKRGGSVMAHVHTLPYRKDVVWSQEGLYKLYIFPASPIKGIEGVGVVIK